MSRQNCTYYTDGGHRYSHATPNPLAGATVACVCGEPKPISLFDQTPAPARGRDPHSSQQAAARVRPKAGSQAARALAVIAATPGGATTRDIQKALYQPADPAWNKVPTRCLWLERKGLVRRHDQTRPDDGQHFLVYEITAAGTDHIREGTPSA